MHPLIRENKALLNNLVEVLKGYKIQGIYIKNPQNVSVFSDIDVYIVCTNEVVETIFNEREKIFNSIDKTLVVWGNKFSNNKYSLNVVFDKQPVPLKIDINIKTIEEIKPSEKLKDCEILYDPSGVLFNAKEESQSITYAYVPDKVELQRILNAFCGWIFNTLSKIKKEDYASVVFEHEVDYVENIILPLYFSLSEGKQEGLYEARQRIDPKLLSQIEQLKLQQVDKLLVNDMQIIVSIYENLAERVSTKYELSYPKEALARIKDILNKFDEY